MHSSGRPNFWIPPEGTYETAVPSPTSTTPLTPEPPTPTRVNPRFNRPPLPLPTAQRTPQRQQTFPSTVRVPSPPQIRHHDRTGKEYNRRERRFESIFEAWSKEVACLQDEHKAANLASHSEEETARATEVFNRKVHAVWAKYSEELEALQMSSSEPPSSQSENEEDEEESPAATPLSAHNSYHSQNSHDEDDKEQDEDEDEDEEEEGSQEETSGSGGSDSEDATTPEHALDDDSEEEGDGYDAESASTPHSEALNVDMSSGDETDHSARLSRRSVKSYQSSEVSHGSLNLRTPPPTEDDEDHRATRRRLARERRKTDELASALPSRLRSSTLRGSSPFDPNPPVAQRPAAMSLFDGMSSSPASISSMQAASPYSTSRRPSRDVNPPTRTSSIEANSPALSSRIDILRRQSSTSGSDRSLSRPRQSSPVNDSKLFKDQFESWKSSIQSQSDAVLKSAEKQAEETKHRFELEQREKQERARLIMIAEQEKILQAINRNRAGSTGSTAINGGSASGSHPRTGSISIPGHGIGPSISPTAQRGIPSGSTPSSSPANRPLHSSVSQTFQYATINSHSPPPGTSPRNWTPKTAPLPPQRSPQKGHPIAQESSSESEEVEGGLDEDESDSQQPGYQGTPPISIPPSARGSFDLGHRRTGSQIYAGTPGASSSTPRSSFPQHLRNSSSTTFSSNGTASARSSGGWSGVSGASTSTTVTSSDTPGSRRGSAGEKTLLPPAGLPSEARKNINGLTVSTSPSGQQARWNHGSMVGSVDPAPATSHSQASTLSRASTLPATAMNANSAVNIPPRSTVQQWHNAASASSPSAASSVPPTGSLPRPVGLNLGQSPGKSSWKSTATGQPSPPIPMQTKPSMSTLSTSIRHRADNSSSNRPPSPKLDNPASRPSPVLRPSMSNVDLASSAENYVALKSRPSTIGRASGAQMLLGKGAHSNSPSKPIIVPPKSSPSPAKVSALKASSPDESPSSGEAEVAMTRRESKKKAKKEGEERRRQEEEERRRREEDLRRREEELKRREAELEREQREEKRRMEAELKRKHEEDLARREAELLRREEAIRKQEAEVAEAKQRRQAEAEANQRKAEAQRQRELQEAEVAETKRRRQAEAEAKRRKAEAQRQRELQEEEAQRQRELLEAEAQRVREAEEEAFRLREQEKSDYARARQLQEEEDMLATRSLQEQDDIAPAREPPRNKKADKKRAAAAKRAAEEQQREREDAAQKERERLEAEQEQLRLEAEKVQRLEAEEAQRLERETRKREAARLAAERREAERREAERLEQERLEHERREAERLDQLKQDLYLQEQKILEESRQRQKAKEERRLAEERRMRQEEERRSASAWSRQQEEERRQEQERQAQEARIRQENARMTEMYQARDRSHQMASNMPKRYADAWEAYDEKWKRLITHAQTQTETKPELTFASVPWPALNPPAGPEAITRNTVGGFILSQWHSRGKTPRDRIREALLRWHPDRFESRFLGWVPEGEERENVREGVGNVARSLNELLTKEATGGAL